MTTSIRRSKSARKASPASKAALGRYLAAGLGAAGLASVDSEAAVVSIDITNVGSTNQNISGANAGLALGYGLVVQNFLGVTGAQFSVNRQASYYNLFGFSSPGQMQFASGGSNSSPTNLTTGFLLGPGSTNFAQSGLGASAVFRYTYNNNNSVAPNFTAPDSHIGFRVGLNGQTFTTVTTTSWLYGYFQVEWNNSLNTFEILSGAYESTPNTAITITAVPEPSAIALCGIGALALGGGAIRRSRKARKAAAEGSLAEAV